MADDAVWPSRAKPRKRDVIVTHGVTITRVTEVAPEPVPLEVSNSHADVFVHNVETTERERVERRVYAPTPTAKPAHKPQARGKVQPRKGGKR